MKAPKDAERESCKERESSPAKRTGHSVHNRATEAIEMLAVPPLGCGEKFFRRIGDEWIGWIGFVAG